MMDALYHICGLPFGWIMRLIYLLVDNYALAILVFTIITRLILFPISYKQQLSSAKMQRLNPKLEKLRKKYKDDQKKLQEEQMKLYQEEHINPGASCLPMFLQFFILFGILDVVYKPLSYILRVTDDVIASAFEVVQKINPTLAEQGTSLRQELTVLMAHHSDPSAFTGTISDSLSAQMSDFYDKFSLFGINLGTTPEWNPEVWNGTTIALFLIPFASGLIQLILTIYTQIMQKKRNPNMPNMGCMNVMLFIMPVFSVVFAFQVPAGVGFYWACSSLFSLIQSIGLYNYFTPGRVEKLVEKENLKLERKYASGKQSFTQRMMGQMQGQTEAEKERAKNIEAAKDMSRSELSKFQNEQIKEARRRMAEKYGDSYTDTGEDTKQP